MIITIQNSRNSSWPWLLNMNAPNWPHHTKTSLVGFDRPVNPKTLTGSHGAATRSPPAGDEPPLPENHGFEFGGLHTKNGDCVWKTDVRWPQCLSSVLSSPLRSSSPTPTVASSSTSQLANVSYLHWFGQNREAVMYLLVWRASASTAQQEASFYILVMEAGTCMQNEMETGQTFFKCCSLGPIWSYAIGPMMHATSLDDSIQSYVSIYFFASLCCFTSSVELM